MSRRDTLFTAPSFRRMAPQGNSWFEHIFRRRILSLSLSSETESRLRDLSRTHQLVYVLKQASLLEFNFFHALLLQRQLPLAQFAPQIQAWVLWWRPWRDALYGLKIWIKEKGWVAWHGWKSYVEQRLQPLLRHSAPVLLCLTPEYRSRAWSTSQVRNSTDYLDTLLTMTRATGKPVAFIPLHFVYDYRAEKKRSKWIGFLTDYRFRQGLIPRFMSFVWGAQRLGELSFGTPLFAFPETYIALDPLTRAHTIAQSLNHAFREERLRLTGPTLATPNELYRELLLSPRFQHDLSVMATATNQNKTTLLNTVEKFFFEIAADMRPSYIDFYDLLLRRLFSSLYKGVSVNEAGIQKLKALPANATVVLIPNHRSHMDYLLLSYILYEYHLTPPHICGGINLNFWPIGHFLRHGGCFFIHRHIDEASAYAFALSAYLDTLVARGYTLEFFIEGTRSRSGKLLRPKSGFLHLLLESSLKTPDRALYLVPVSITYDKILEEHSYAQERAGAAKRKESFSSFLQVRKFLRSNYGQVHLTFSEPLSFDALRQEHGIETLPIPHTLTSHIAAKIAHHINQQLVVTAGSIVAMVFLQSAGTALSQDDVLERAAVYLHYLGYRARPLSPELVRDPRQALHDAVALLSRTRLLHPLENAAGRFFVVDPDKRLSLDYYKNYSIHFFISLICVSKVIVTSSDPMTLSALAAEFDRLKALFRLEFTFSLRKSTDEHTEELITYLESVSMVRREGEQLLVPKAEERVRLHRFADLLTPFLESYWLTLLSLETLSFSRLHRKALIKKIIELGRTHHLQGQLHCPESLNPLTVENALDLFHSRGFVRRHDAQEGKKGREFYTTEATVPAVPKEKQWIKNLL